MKRTADPGSVVAAERADPALDCTKIGAANLPGEQLTVTGLDPSERPAAKIKDEFGESLTLPIEATHRAGDVIGEELDQQFEVVGARGEDGRDAHAGSSVDRLALDRFVMRGG